ncbi:alpha/beta fold hydrolase [Microbacterium sp. SORGH_AS_0862]|uniref:alpha/beta fold hydrolase n=1 Tax=Microbacterium sp. SORGH_AS_0862 TaxID=3041789 RepID=UPI00278DF59F|nr:alpha/beta hydrolase [Microbacterium sp. SORGH_AS_0862]MDQ1204164.1 pimeloyl-ACP methyl ester carboxylesterase [Microbacterium sp. SORGH_AS_0862]
MTDDAFDEFSFLPAQAESLGLTTPLPPTERHSLTLADGRTLSALRYGDEPPVVTFLHGAGLNAHTWDTTILALGRPALAIDLAGHGDSSWRDDARYVARTLAEDVGPALEAWTEAPQVLVGHSLGALTATAVAAARGDLVRSLVLIDLTPGVDPTAGPAQMRAFFAGPTDWADREELVERALSFGLGGSRQAATRGVYLNSRVRPDGRVEWKHHFAHLAAAAAASDAGASAPDAMRELLAASGWDDLAAVHTPVTLVRGDAGYVTEADADEFRRRRPDADVVVVPAHHNVHEQIPDRLAALLGRIVEAA